MNKSETVVSFLNSNMKEGESYSYQEILKWGKDNKIKEGTLTSVLTKIKGTGAIVHNEVTGLRTKVSLITFKAIREYDREHYKQTGNDNGVTQKVCNKVKALRSAKFNVDEVSNILKLDSQVVEDIVECKYNIHEYNGLFRKNNNNTNEPFLQSLEGLKDAVNTTIIAFREYGL